MPRALLTLIALAACACSGAALGEAAPEPPGRPVVLLVHGAGVEDQDTTQLRRGWARALDEGIRTVRDHGILAREDVRLVWYADALADTVRTGCAEEREGARERPTGWAGNVGTVLGGAGTLMATVGAWMGGAEGDALETLARDLSWLGDDRRRCAAGQRLADALARAHAERRPVILVTHSFGGMVAYDHLLTRDAPEPVVDRWITVGSLVGHPEVRELLLAGGPGRLPDGVGSWVNVRDPADPLSAGLRGVEPAEDRPGSVEDRRTERPARGDAHEMERYLGDPATARAVLEAWCAAGGSCAPGGSPSASRPVEAGARQWTTMPTAMPNGGAAHISGYASVR